MTGPLLPLGWEALTQAEAEQDARVAAVKDQWGKPLDPTALRAIVEAAPAGSDWWYDGRDLFYKPAGTNLDQVIVPLPETWHQSQEVPHVVGVLIAAAVNYLRAALKGER